MIIPPYFDNIYGWVEVVTDNNGVLIDINPVTGQRIFPFTGFAGNFFPAFVAGNVANVPFINANVCNGIFGCPGPFNGGAFNNFCNVNINCGTIPAGLVNAGGGLFTYRDNRFCGDGMLGFVFGRGSFCLNGQPLFANGNGFFPNNVVFRPFEVTQPTAATVAVPVTAAPAAVVTTTVAAPAAVEQTPVVTAPASMPTALGAPAAGGGNTHVLSAPELPAPSPPFDRDGKG